MKLEPVFVEVEQIKRYHGALLALYGGTPGIADEALLEAAMHAPRFKHLYGGDHLTLFDLAAAYAYHLAKNHAFVDGNKRAAMAAADVFLELNGWSFYAAENETTRAIERLAAGELSEGQLRDFLAEHSVWVGIEE